MALIFEPDSCVVRRGVEGLLDVASLVHTVYMIVSHDWLDGRSAARGSIAIIVHCVQESDVWYCSNSGVQFNGSPTNLAVSCLQIGSFFV